MLCPHCADGHDRQSAHRTYLLQLLALIEHPTALPPDAALRIAYEILAWTGLETSDCECEHSEARVTAFETAA